MSGKTPPEAEDAVGHQQENEDEDAEDDRVDVAARPEGGDLPLEHAEEQGADEDALGALQPAQHGAGEPLERERDAEAAAAGEGDRRDEDAGHGGEAERERERHGP